MEERVAPRITIRVGMRVWDNRVDLELTLPAAPVRLESLLPVFQRVSDGLVDLAAQRAAARGRTVSCAKGCGACCRQVVPISEAEARRIGRLVDELPEPRRREVLGRFEEALGRLARAGLLERLEARDGLEPAELSSVGLAYFHLGIPCPFLEEESCSIHAERPIACREYLVSSPAASCSDPRPDTIDQVEMPTNLWAAVARAGSSGPPSRSVPWLPLVLAPGWASAHPDLSEPRPVEELIRKVLVEERAHRPDGPPREGAGFPLGL